jgi:hypothetical protein
MPSHTGFRLAGGRAKFGRHIVTDHFACIDAL